MGLKKFKDILKNPKSLLIKLNYRYPMLLSWMTDEQCIRFWYRYNFGKKLDLNTPKTFNEKLQRLKLYDRKPEYTRMVDKYEAKKYVTELIGEEYIIPTLGVWDTFDEINFDALPDQFVLKCTHDSGGLMICRDKSTFDKKMARKRIERSMKRNFFWVGREWPYKDVKPRIIAEKYMEDSEENRLEDYKVHCFNGIPQMTLVCSRRFSEQGLCENFFDCASQHLPVKRSEDPNLSIEKPINFEKMNELARQLSEDIPFVRTDFYEINGKVYFGELTFYPASGFSGFDPEYWDKKIGEWIELPAKSGGGYFTVSKNLIFIFKEKKEAKDRNLTDYKFFCFNGQVDSVMVCLDRLSGDTKFYFFDRAWKLLRYNIRGKNAPENFKIPKPSNIDEMFDIAEKLSKDLTFARIDLYSVSGRTFFGEITFFPDSGFDSNLLPKTDLHWGQMIDISKINLEVNGK